MEEKKIVVGLDIGTTKICATIAQFDIKTRSITLLGISNITSENLIKEYLTNIQKVSFSIQKAIQDLESQTKIDIRTINVGISGPFIHSMIQQGSMMRKSLEEEITLEDIHLLTKDMYRIVLPPGEEIIHVIPQNYTIDNQKGIKDPIGISGIKLLGNFYIVTAKDHIVKNISKCLQKASLHTSSIVLESIASSLAVISKEEKEIGICLIDMGASQTNLIIYQDAIIKYISSIPLGGNMITEDICNGFKIRKKEAEALKKKFGNALKEEVDQQDVVLIPGIKGRIPTEVSIYNLNLIIESRLEEIIELIHLEILKSKLLDKLLGGLILTGGTAKIKNIEQIFQYMTQMETRLGYVNDQIVNESQQEKLELEHITSIGLVLAGCEKFNKNSKFYLNQQRKEFISNQPRKDLKTKKKPFLKRIFEKTKELLIDDYEEQEKYRN